MIKRYLACCFIVLIAACGKQKEQTTAGTYYDVAAYFKSEAIRLNKLKQPIAKTVMINGDTEAKSLIIKDWNKELSSFIQADINKISWKGLFSVHETADTLLYKSDNEKVQVKQLLVTRANGQVNRISITIKRENLIYTSMDTLDYVPDDFYSIRKTQHIKLLKEKQYVITGKFKK